MSGRLTSPELVTLTEFWTMCKRADWFYGYSDDPSVYRKGCIESDNLWRIASTSPAYLEIHTRWKNYFDDYTNKSRVEPPMPVEVAA